MAIRLITFQMRDSLTRFGLASPRACARALRLSLASGDWGETSLTRP